MSDPEHSPAGSPHPVRRRGTKGAPPPQSSVLGALSEVTANPGKAAEAATPAEPARTDGPAPESPKKAKAKPAKTASPEAPKEKPRKAAKTAKERTEPLNFRVTAEFRRAFKRAAAAQDCKKVELLERVFTEWQARNPA